MATENDFPSRQELALFLDSIHSAVNATVLGEFPSVDAPRKIVEHFNRGRMAGVDSVGYFIYEGVKVYEEGKREEADRKENLTAEEIVFGAKAKP